MTPFDLSLYLVLDPDLCGARGMVETTRLAVAGGATMVQLRHKSADTRAMVEIGRALQAVLRETATPLIVNDDVEAAIELGAEGIHVGQEDRPAIEIRDRVGHGMIIGLSIGSVAEASAIDPAAVDYVGIGPVFATATKPDHAPAIGFAGLAKIAALCTVPVVAIGGLKREHVPAVFAAGAQGLAVVSAICGTPDPQTAALALAEDIARARR